MFLDCFIRPGSCSVAMCGQYIVRPSGNISVVSF